MYCAVPATSKLSSANGFLALRLQKLRCPARLPLWVVIDRDGKIDHYHVGFYAIKPDEGLRPLDEAVMKQIKTKKGRLLPANATRNPNDGWQELTLLGYRTVK